MYRYGRALILLAAFGVAACGPKREAPPASGSGLGAGVDSQAVKDSIARADTLGMLYDSAQAQPSTPKP